MAENILSDAEVSRLRDLEHKEASGGYTPVEKEELALLREKRDGIVHEEVAAEEAPTGEETHNLTEDELPNDGPHGAPEVGEAPVGTGHAPLEGEGNVPMGAPDAPLTPGTEESGKDVE